MPYNTTAIPPRREPSGTTQLPLSRVRKMIMQDQDIAVCANSAAFVLTLATELFIQYLAEQGHNVVKSEKKPRRNIQYRDLSKAVAQLDNLQFLEDIVPRTVPFAEIKAKASAKGKKPSSSTLASAATVANGEASGSSNGSGSGSVETGQTMLDSKAFPVAVAVANGNRNGAVNGDAELLDGDVDADPNTQLEIESRGAGARLSTGLNGQEDVDMS
ncbi:DNA polymerase epsilon subunit C [Lachnellula hyalina]|uniref:DNA polymerase epsilon subunit C n=1 Tax=Lachnellula hyalina TaxID=1316788 RepID=A0A8H8TX00_9HELO|nr:DNA polymerase epsilon subunit C [Lachnellula hyalina]TVY25479.1 DNA polymerase epsilon subunit C [Lachnellula hyalina]